MSIVCSPTVVARALRLLRRDIFAVISNNQNGTHPEIPVPGNQAKSLRAPGPRLERAALPPGFRTCSWHRYLSKLAEEEVCALEQEHQASLKMSTCLLRRRDRKSIRPPGWICLLLEPWCLRCSWFWPLGHFGQSRVIGYCYHLGRQRSCRVSSRISENQWYRCSLSDTCYRMPQYSRKRRRRKLKGRKRRKKGTSISQCWVLWVKMVNLVWVENCESECIKPKWASVTKCLHSHAAAKSVSSTYCTALTRQSSESRYQASWSPWSFLGYYR